MFCIWRLQGLIGIQIKWRSIQCYIKNIYTRIFMQIISLIVYDIWLINFFSFKQEHQISLKQQQFVITKFFNRYIRPAAEISLEELKVTYITYVGARGNMKHNGAVLKVLIPVQESKNLLISTIASPVIVHQLIKFSLFGGFKGKHLRFC